MVCRDCGNVLLEKQSTCSYCGKYHAGATTIKKQKRILILLWSLTIFIGSLAAFTFFEDTILHFLLELSEKMKVYTLLFSFFIG